MAAHPLCSDGCWAEPTVRWGWRWHRSECTIDKAPQNPESRWGHRHKTQAKEGSFFLLQFKESICPRVSGRGGLDSALQSHHLRTQRIPVPASEEGRIRDAVCVNSSTCHASIYVSDYLFGYMGHRQTQSFMDFGPFWSI